MTGLDFHILSNQQRKEAVYNECGQALKNHQVYGPVYRHPAGIHHLEISLSIDLGEPEVNIIDADFVRCCG